MFEDVSRRKSRNRWRWAGLLFVVASIWGPAQAAACGTLNPGESLAPGQAVSTCNGNGQLIHQADGNVVFYDQAGALWATGTNGSATSRLIMQGDGNLVLYGPGGTPLWHTHTHGNPGAWLAVQGDCNLVIYSATQSVLWASNTRCRSAPPSPTSPTIKFFELLLRIDGVKLVRPNSPGVFQPFGAVQCCAAQAGVDNSRWPLASESWMDFTGANMFHFRMGPFHADAEHEPEWADIGGPYIGSGPDFNPAFWSKVKALLDHAGEKKANVEINVIDTWYCKHAASNWGDQQMPWPQVDIDACGIRGTDVQERYIRKVVSETGCYANVIYVTDNEGGEIIGHARAWYDFVYATIRDEEQKSGCGVVHLIGTNNEQYADGPFDYVATHAREPLTTPIAGKHTENNERNPAFSPEQEYANFCAARRAGLNYWYWRDGMSDPEAEQTLNLFRGGCGEMQPNSAVRGCSNWSWWNPVYQPSANSCASFCTQNGANACEWYQNGDCYVEFGNGCYVQSGFPGWSAAVSGGPPPPPR